MGGDFDSYSSIHFFQFIRISKLQQIEFHVLNMRECQIVTYTVATPRGGLVT